MPAPHSTSSSSSDASISDAFVSDASSGTSAATPTDGPRRFSRRRFLAGSAAIPLTVLLGDKLEALASPAAIKRFGPQGACGLPPYVLTRLWRGYRRGKGGQIFVVPHGRNFLGAGAPHAGPWPYTQDVPMLWYGPDVIKPTSSISRQVTSADIAPTLARLVGFDGADQFRAPDGHSMDEVQLVDPSNPPKLIVVMVWDAGGRFVLDLWPNHWPNLRRMRPGGVWFDRASVGSSPSNTAPIHATIGTGAFPRHHGIIDNVMWSDDGLIHSAWAAGPSVMEVPGFAEVYQQAYGDEVLIGMAGSVSWHLGMVGRGNNTSDSAPKPVVVLKNDGDDGGDVAPPWEMPPSVEGYYRFADYVRDLPPIDDYFDYANQLDGTKDGLWRGKDLHSLEGGWASPARIPYQTKAIKKLVTQEGFGTHGRTDLLFINYKVIDEIGHRYYASSPEMADSIRAQDHFLGDFVKFLNEKVGKGQWAMLLTADHGHTAKPGQGGGYLINQRAVQAAVESLRHTESDPAILAQVRPMWFNIDDDAIKTADRTYTDISKLVAGLTKDDTRMSGHGLADPNHALLDNPNEPVFDAVFASSLIERLTCPAWHSPTP